MKKKWWDLPAQVKEPIMKELEAKFRLLFEKLKVGNTKDIVKKNVRLAVIKKEVNYSLLGL